MNVRACLLAGLLVLGVVRTAFAEGHHVRLRTRHGPVHVWTPANYDEATAGLIVYVHGYYVNVDEAWRRHHLAAQFRDSGVDAMFVACDAPRGPRQRLVWRSLSDLLDAVEHGLRHPLPDGPVTVIGHSGAHRTLVAWLDDDRIDTIVMVDAMYGDMPDLREWLVRAPRRRLIDVGDLTRRWTEALHASLPETQVYDGFPPPEEGRLIGARDAQIVYVRSQLGHMPLVTDGVALPMLLRALRIPMVTGASRSDPLAVP